MLTCLGVILFASVSASAPPFWKTNETIYQRILDREVIVSVKSVEGPALSMNGGGIVNANVLKVYTTAIDYAVLPRISGYIESADYQATTNELSVKISAFGQSAQFVIKMQPDKIDLNDSLLARRLGFEIIKGPMTGLKGEFTFTSLSSNKTEVGLSGIYAYKKLTIAKFFVEFGMEVMFQKMAIRLREYVEKQA